MRVVGSREDLKSLIWDTNHGVGTILYIPKVFTSAKVKPSVLLKKSMS
jgi:hypothetical protein